MSEKDLFNICLKLLSKKFKFLVRLPLIKTRIDLKGYFEVAFFENRANRDTINLFRNLVVAFLAKLSVTWQLWMGWGGEVVRAREGKYTVPVTLVPLLDITARWQTKFRTESSGVQIQIWLKT